MTPVFSCGFECGVSGAHFTNAASASFNTSIVRSGVRSLRCNPTAVATGYSFITFPSSSDKWVIRCYVRFETLPSVDIELVTLQSRASGARFKQSDSKIYATASFINGATGVPVTTGVWYRIDVKIDLTANPWLVDVSVDGVACGQASNSAAASSDVTFKLSSTSSNTSDIYYDDVIISQTLADFPIGSGYVNHFVPTADGTHNVAGANDFERTLTGVDIINTTTDAYLLVDDVPLESTPTDWIGMEAPPNATDYVECIFGPAPGISTPTNPPRAVEVIAAIHQAGATVGNMEIRMNDNGTEDAMYSATGVVGSTTLLYKRKHYAAGPAGAWVIGGGGNGDFTDLRVRFGSPAALDVNPDQYFDCIMIEAEFEEIAVVPPIPNKIYQKNQAVNRASTY